MVTRLLSKPGLSNWSVEDATPDVKAVPVSAWLTVTAGLLWAVIMLAIRF